MTDRKVCGFCGIPTVKHEGGMTFDNKEFTDHFCSERCFENWVKWKAAIMSAVIHPGISESVIEHDN